MSKETTQFLILCFVCVATAYGSVNAGDHRNDFLNTIRSSAEAIYSIPQSEFVLTNKELYERQGNYRDFPAGRYTSQFLSDVEAQLKIYFSLPFGQWVEASNYLLQIDKYVSVHNEYGNLLIKAFITDLIFNQMLDRVQERSKTPDFDLDVMYELVMRFRYHLPDGTATSVMLYEDFPVGNFDLKLGINRSLNATDSSIKDRYGSTSKKKLVSKKSKSEVVAYAKRANRSMDDIDKEFDHMVAERRRKVSKAIEAGGDPSSIIFYLDNPIMGNLIQAQDRLRHYQRSLFVKMRILRKKVQIFMTGRRWVIRIIFKSVGRILGV